MALAPTLTTTTTTTTADHRRLLHYLTEHATTLRHIKQIHAAALRTLPPHHPQTLFLNSRILHCYSLHSPHYTSRLFSQIEHPNSFAYNTLIRAYANSTNHKSNAFLVYVKMVTEGNVAPDKHTFPFVLKACAYLFARSEGKQVHNHVLKNGFGSDVYVNNSLIHFYASCGCLDDARELFDEMPERSVVSWNAMIDGLVQFGEFDEALECFREMQTGFEADGYGIQSVMRACAGLGVLSLGMWAHAYVLRNFKDELGDDVLVNNCLLDMYCKCGSFDFARQVFERMGRRDVASWNAMVLGFAMHGQAEEALEFFAQMVHEDQIMPNSITFCGVLSACSHRGMVNEGRKYFNVMVEEYGIEPVLEHYGCLVDLLARAGLIGDALDVVSDMPMKPDDVIWRSLLDACCKKNVGVKASEEVARKIMASEGGELSGVYVLLSRVYAEANKWDEVGLVRKLMTDKGITKEPGCSSIEIDGVAHEFFAGDTSRILTL